jgi:hypothetical protein
MNEHARELKRQKPIDQGESKLFVTVLLSDSLHMQYTHIIWNVSAEHPALPGDWKCEFCHSSKTTEVSPRQTRARVNFLCSHLFRT